MKPLSVNTVSNLNKLLVVLCMLGGPVVSVLVVNLDTIGSGVVTLSPSGLLIGLVCGCLLARWVWLHKPLHGIHRPSVNATKDGRAS